MIAGETGHAHATVWRCLRRAGLSRPPRRERDAPRLYEWPCPGDLLHIDTKRFARFTRPGHAVTGDRHTTSAQKRLRVGYEWVHSLIDDHSRLAYSELHSDEKAATVTGFVQRGLAFFARLGITPKRLMSDNAWTYRHNRSLQALLAGHGSSTCSSLRGAHRSTLRRVSPPIAHHVCAILVARGPIPAPPRLTLTARSPVLCRGLEAGTCLLSSSSWPSFSLRCTSCATGCRCFGVEPRREASAAW